MANENKKMNELVSDDDDPTAELEALTVQHVFGSDKQEHEAESDANTFQFDDLENDGKSGVSVSDLRTDLKTRSETIERLQFDIEQLHAKWLGLEAEITAREELTSNLTTDLKSAERKLDRKDKLLQKRHSAVKSLESEVRELNQKNSELRELSDKYRAAKTELEAGDEITVARQRIIKYEGENSSLTAALTESRTQQEQTESYADELRWKLADLTANSVGAFSERDKLRDVVNDAEAENNALKLDLEQALTFAENSDQALEDERGEHEQEIRTLRFELGDAQNTLAERDELSEQLAANLVDTKENKEQLEQILTDNVKQSQGRIGDLEHQLNKQQSKIADTESTLAERDHLSRQLADDLADTEENRERLEQTLTDNEKQSQRRIQDLETQLNKQQSTIADTENTLAEHKQRNKQLATDLGDTRENREQLERMLTDNETQSQRRIDDLEKQLEKQQSTIADVENMLAERDQLSKELAGDLGNTREDREKLERKLAENESQYQSRIDDLEKQLGKQELKVADYEDKLVSKGETINSLLSELAQKSKEIDSIGEMEDVIQEIDDRMSERIDDHPPTMSGERVTRLLIGRIDEQELRFPLFKDRLTIGRTQQNDIQLDAQFISRRHAVVVTEGDATRVIDWGSKNGVYVNSNRVTEHFLKNGDIVTIGTADFRYEERPKRDN